MDTDDVVPELEAALKCLRIEAHEADPEELDGYVFPGEQIPCTCPPDLIARGGFTSTCRAEHKHQEASEALR